MCMQSIIVLYLHLLLSLSQRQVTGVEGLMFLHRVVVLAYSYLCMCLYRYMLI